MNFLVEASKMFEFSSWEEALSNVGKNLTTAKWLIRVKKDVEGKEFVWCRLVARGSAWSSS